MSRSRLWAEIVKTGFQPFLKRQPQLVRPSGSDYAGKILIGKTEPEVACFVGISHIPILCFTSALWKLQKILLLNSSYSQIEDHRARAPPCGTMKD